MCILTEPSRAYLYKRAGVRFVRARESMSRQRPGTRLAMSGHRNALKACTRYTLSSEPSQSPFQNQRMEGSI